MSDDRFVRVSGPTLDAPFEGGVPSRCHRRSGSDRSGGAALAVMLTLAAVVLVAVAVWLLWDETGSSGAGASGEQATAETSATSREETSKHAGGKAERSSQTSNGTSRSSGASSTDASADGENPSTDDASSSPSRRARKRSAATGDAGSVGSGRSETTASTGGGRSPGSPSPEPARPGTRPDVADALDTPIEGAVPALSEEKALPPQPKIGGAGEGKDESSTRPLIGTWEQTDGGNGADFAVGGYRRSRLRFGRTGKLTVVRRFGASGNVQVVRRLRYSLDGDTIRLEPAGEKKETRSIADATDLSPQGGGEKIRLVPPKLDLPTSLPIAVDGDRVELGDKTYRRVSAAGG